MTLRTVVERVRALPASAADGLLALALFAAGAVELSVGPVGGHGGDAGPVAFVLLGGMTLPLWWRRRFPVIVVIGTLGVVGPVLQLPLAFSAVFAIMVAVYTAAAEGPRQVAIGTAVATTIALAIVAVAILAHGAVFSDVVANYVLFGTAWILGDNVRHRRAYERALVRRAELAEREREERAQRAAAEERARIARELHDIVSHTVSVMVVQAGAARRAADRDPEAAHRAVETIERTGRQALDELRRLLGVLRENGDRPHLAPQPGVAALEELVDELRAAGLDVTAEVEGPVPQLPVALEVSAFRIAQEALTNTLKHAGPARAVIRVRADDDRLVLEVEDDGYGPPPRDAAPRHGHGLVGMRERVAMFGGTLHTGPRPGGGYRVRASFPLADGGDQP